MSALAFPPVAFVGMTYTSPTTGKTWVFDGYAWTGSSSSQRIRYGRITYKPSLIVSLDQFDVVDISVDGPLTFDCTGGADGQVLRVRFAQGGAGNNPVTFGSSIRVSNDLPAFAVSTIAGRQDWLGFARNAAAGGYDFLSFVRGF